MSYPGHPFFTGWGVCWSFIGKCYWWMLILFTNPSALAGYDTSSIFKQILTGLNSEFSFSKTSCLTKAEEPSLSYYLPIAGGRIIGFIPFRRALVLCEMQSASSRIELVSPCPFHMTITITPRAISMEDVYLDYWIVEDKNDTHET